MAGTLTGGKLAAKTNKERYGKDFYKVQGRKGGLVKGTKGGFASLCKCTIYKEEHLRARCSGAKGGLVSTRGQAKVKQPQAVEVVDKQETKLVKGLVSLGINLKEVGERYLSRG